MEENTMECILCLDSCQINCKSHNKNSTKNPLFALANYLSIPDKLNCTNNSTLNREFELSSSSSSLDISLCVECHTLLETFMNLLKQLEIAKLKVDSCVRQIRDVMLEGNKFGGETSEVSMKQSFRTCLLENAERQVATSEPTVKLHRKRFISSHHLSRDTFEPMLEMQIKSEAVENADDIDMHLEIEIGVPFLKIEQATRPIEIVEVVLNENKPGESENVKANDSEVELGTLPKLPPFKGNTHNPEELQYWPNSVTEKVKASHLDWIQALSGNCTQTGMQMLNQMMDLDIITVTVNKLTEFLNFGLICDAKKRGLRPVIFPSGLLLLEKDEPAKKPDILRDWHCVSCWLPPAEDGVMVYSLKDLAGKAYDLKRPYLMHTSCSQKQKKINQSFTCQINLQSSADKDLREFHLPVRLMKAYSLELKRMELRRKLKEVKVHEKERKGSNQKRSEGLLKRNQVIDQIKEMGPHFELEEEIAYLNENLMKDMEIDNAKLSAQGSGDLLQNERESDWRIMAATFFLKELNDERNARLEQDKNSVDQYTCPYCFLVLGNRNKKSAHVRKVHEKEYLIRCTNHPDCEYVDRSSSNVRRHQQRKKACPYKKVHYKSRSHIP